MTDRHHTSTSRVACLTYSGLCQDGIASALNHIAPHSKAVRVSPQHLRFDVLKNYEMLVLPGIIGEDSPYPDILSKNRMSHILKAVEENGLTLWTSCAATYFLFESLSYTKRNGERKEMEGLGVLKGHASGPAYSHVTRTRFNGAAKNDLVLAEIEWMGQGSFRALDINGPALHIMENGGITTEFLRYANIPQTPAAGFVKRIGKGKIVGLSFHPELPLTHPNLPLSHAHHEENRISFLDLLGEKIFAPKVN